MATRLRGRVDRRINLNAEEDESLYPFDEHIGKMKQYPQKIDIVHLLHDIHALNLSNDTRRVMDTIKGEIGNYTLSSLQQIADFVTFAVRKISKHYYYGSSASANRYQTDGPNWMLLLYHDKVCKDIHQKLSVISPILTLFDVECLYCMRNEDIISLISSLIIIRRNIPFSSLRGIDTDYADDDDYKYSYCIDYGDLFGESLMPYTLHDLCKYIVTFLDIKSFFKCSTINCAWLHFIYRNDTFSSIYKQIVCEDKHLKCILSDHSILSQVHVATAPITIGWTLQCHNNSYLDFVTLNDHWFQQYVDALQITLQEKASTSDKWMDIKQCTKTSNEVGFDALIMTDGFQFDENALYRMRLEIMKPFKSCYIYSAENPLNPKQWMLRYNECQARDDIDDVKDSNHRLFHIHVFWFDFYVDLLQSLNTNVISDVLKNLRICQNRIRCDTAYLQKQYSNYMISLFKSMIRYLFHENNKIKLNAMRCLRRIAIQDTKEMQEYYLNALAEHGLIKICENMLVQIRDKHNNTICSLREQMLWFLGYYIKTGCKWKSILIKEMDIGRFLAFIREEIELNKNPKYTASYIWMLSKFFSLYHQTRSDDLLCDNHVVITPKLGNITLKLMWKSFRGSFRVYKNLCLEQMQSRDDERQKQIDGWRCVVRDSYYAYSMVLRYFNAEILEIMDSNILHDIIAGFDLAIDGMDGNEFALRMVRTSLSCCVDVVFRLDKYNKQIVDAGYLDKLYAILDAMIKKLNFLIMIKEKKIDITHVRNALHSEDEKPKEDEFMMLYPPILEAMPIIANNITEICDAAYAKRKITKFLCVIVDVAVLHWDYLNRSDFSDESVQDSQDRESDLQDEICCTMAVIWDVMTRYGRDIREYIMDNPKIMDLIQYWARHDNMVTANQAHSLLTALINDDVFDALFDDKKQGYIECDDMVVLCPCGDALKLKEAKDCYQATSYCYLYCDYCREKIDWSINPKRMVYHCDKKENIHPHGFDLCVNCSKRKFILDLKK